MEQFITELLKTVQVLQQVHFESRVLVDITWKVPCLSNATIVVKQDFSSVLETPDEC